MQGNYDEFRFFTGLRLSEDRSIRLCPRVVAVLERQLRFRERFVREGSITHTCSLLTKAPHSRSEVSARASEAHAQATADPLPQTLYGRHTSVSWNLMLGRNPMLVAKEHGHRVLTMLTVYAAWVEGAIERDIIAIRAAMDYPPLATDGIYAPIDRELRSSPDLVQTPLEQEALGVDHSGSRNLEDDTEWIELPLSGSEFGSTTLPLLANLLKELLAKVSTWFTSWY